MSRSGMAALHAREAREQCRQYGHRSHPTWEMGHVVCTRCGKLAVCPVCVPQWPATTQHLLLCPTHRPQEVEL